MNIAPHKQLLPQYWIISARNQVCRIIHQCVICNRFCRTNLQQRMAPLPAERVTANRPFNLTGLDFAGPFSCKTSLLKRTQTTKGYLCIFVCLTTKATHLEFLSSMSVNNFIAALHRFIARRGASHTLFSDNAKTFTSTARKMYELENLLKTMPSEVKCFLSNYGINWKFIPLMLRIKEAYGKPPSNPPKHCYTAVLGTQLLHTKSMTPFSLELKVF
ncbi:uncharacterized protein LOC120355998 [Nilaparvata lugens]|uniref:uncharacterized protein LOC120355998 n=1 Tax=Nilaparvata lugens TaxID=108931 RepID=UPI00193E873C|nr:uncharacterized protein LOC120355998 [Nilaparvata lugens]